MRSDLDAPVSLGVDRRLHPLSWLFIVLEQLKAFAIPLLLLVLTGRGNANELWGLVGVLALAGTAVVRYLTFRFRLGPDGIVLTSGFIQRTRRDIPYERIHDVALVQNVVHRVFGVAEVRLESAGGKKAEGEMRVLALADARALEEFVRDRRHVGDPAGATVAEAVPPSEILLSLPPGELVRLGLISNRGMVIVAAAFGGLWQVMPDDWPRTIGQLVAGWMELGVRQFPAWLIGPVGLTVAAVSLLVALVIGLRVLSILLAFLQFHGFTLTQIGRQLRVERGLLSRHRHHVPMHRIQAWHVVETVLHRWFGRQSVTVDSATSHGDDDSGTRDLIPLATPERLTAMMNRVLPDAQWPIASWDRLHQGAWRRLVVVPALFVLAATGVAMWRLGAMGAMGLAGLPLVVIRARIWATNAGYAEVGDRVIAVRGGWLRRSWHVAEVGKLQTLSVSESPFDRRHRMATLWLDTAGVSAPAGALRVPYLPVDVAHALHERLAAGLDRLHAAAETSSTAPDAR